MSNIGDMQADASIATIELEGFTVSKMPVVGCRLAAVLGELFG